MATERKRFLVSTALVTALLFVVTVLVPRVAAWRAAAVWNRSEREAGNQLLHIRAVLGTDTDEPPAEVRIADARRSADAALSALASADASIRTGERLVSAIGRVVPIHPRAAPGNISLAARTRSLADRLGWLDGAIPMLRKIAGYDAARDVAAAPDPHGAFLRLYAARAGLEQAAAALANPPATIADDGLRAARERALRAHELAAPAIRALDVGDPTAAQRLAAFVAASDAAAAAATDALARLTGHAFLATLAADAYWISAQ